MTVTEGVLLAQAFASCFMCGLIWFVQVVHYPLFGLVRGDASDTYARAHQQRTTLVVGPPMLVEALAAGWTALRPPEHVPMPAALAGLGLVAALWLSTAFVLVPLHARLADEGHTSGVVSGLVRWNWPRTVLWTARAVLAFWMLAAGS